MVFRVLVPNAEKICEKDGVREAEVACATNVRGCKGGFFQIDEVAVGLPGSGVPGCGGREKP